MKASEHGKQRHALTVAARRELEREMFANPEARAQALTYCLANSRDDDSGCRLWTGDAYKRGYGRACIFSARFYSHRLMYLAVNGPIADRLVVCHRCNVRACCNPSHLYAGTQKQNSEDSQRAGTFRNPIALCNASKTHCSNGHEYTPENTRRSRVGKRHCKMCDHEWNALRRAERARKERAA